MSRRKDHNTGNWIFNICARQYTGSNRQRRRHPEQYGNYIQRSGANRQRATDENKELPEMQRAGHDPAREAKGKDK